ncbi:MAG: antibiotic biosynthesis monooxygenase family protein, partial [Candidatus Puniceispirillaceae bacterium]
CAIPDGAARGLGPGGWLDILCRRDKTMTTNDDDIEELPVPSSDGWPERYFAVIFTNQRTMSDDGMYSLTSERMVELAQQQPGFLGVESVRGEDGIGITVSYWRDRAAIRNWRVNVEHLAAQQMGRQEFYSWYHLRVAEVVTHRSYDAGDMVAGD